MAFPPPAPRLVLTVLLLALPLAPMAEGSGTGEGSYTGSGSGTGEGSSTSAGSGTGDPGDTGSGVVGSGTTSYDAPLTFNLGGGTVTLATAILNGGTVTNGTINASAGFTAYSGSVSAQLTGAAGLTKSTAGTLTLSGTNSYTGGTTIEAGTLRVGDGSATGSLTGNVVNHGTLVFNRSDDLTFAGTISGTGALESIGGIIRFTSPQTYTGATTISSGYLVLPTDVDQGLSASTTVHVAGGAFFDLSNRAQTIAGLTGAGTVYSFGGSTGSLTVATPVGERQTFAGTLGGGQPEFALTKSGGGTLVLSGANTHTGTTTVGAGTLLINGSLNFSGVTVASGGTLGGTGAIAGASEVQSGGILAPGDTVGTLYFADGLVLGSGAVLAFDLGTTSDLVVIGGGTLTGPSGGTVTLNLSDSGGLGAATYNLFTFTSATLSGFDVSDFTIGTSPSGWNYQFGLTADHLQLTVSAIPEPSAVALGLGAAALAVAWFRRRRDPA